MQSRMDSRFNFELISPEEVRQDRSNFSTERLLFSTAVQLRSVEGARYESNLGSLN